MIAANSKTAATEYFRRTTTNQLTEQFLPIVRDATEKTGEIVQGIQLLAETEGIFTEPAGGVTVAAARNLIERGAIPRDESIVICITGNGYKTIEAIQGHGVEPIRIGRSLADFENSEAAAAAAAS